MESLLMRVLGVMGSEEVEGAGQGIAGETGSLRFHFGRDYARGLT